MKVYLFYFLCILALYSAFMVVISKKPIHTVLYLTLAMFCLGGHYVLLNAQFLAVVHIIVYAGAIMVLFLFTVMLLNLNKEGEFQKPALVQVAAMAAGGILMITLVGVLKQTDVVMAKDPTMTQIGLVSSLAKVLYHEYLLPFEVSSVLFLSAMVGAVLLGKKD
ncbi:MAG: NADH-quinone oxidoreductase subunit J [Bacteroidetes bacterium]|nr:NADH-quinone oxidoreductase subunit J [Bacteroidota bacterium]